MVEVKVLAAHGSGYGDSYEKKKGESYSLPEALADTLAEQGLVELPKPKK